MTTSLFVRYSTTSRSEASSKYIHPGSSEDPTREANKRSQYAKMDEYARDNIHLVAQQFARSSSDDDDVVVDNPNFDESTEVV